MADRVRVLCIKKTDRKNHWERISHIGGKNPDGKPWLLAEEKAIEGIESKKWEFYVHVPPALPVNVVIAEGPSRRKYLKTEPDGDIPNNLLSLPECP